MPSLPLGELYELLRAEGFAIGVGDHVRIGRLLACEAAWTPELLRTSIAALLVTGPGERQAFNACWERWMGSPEASPPAELAPTSAPARTSRLARRAVFLAGLTAMVLGVALAAQYGACRGSPSVPPQFATPGASLIDPGTVPPLDAGIAPPAHADPVSPEDTGHVVPVDNGGVRLVDTGAPSSIDADHADHAGLTTDAGDVVVVSRNHPQPPSSEPASDIALVAFVVGLLALAVAAIAGVRAARARRRFVPGPWRYALAVPSPTKPVLSRVAIEDAAADLTWRVPELDDEIDVARSVSATVAQGGLPTLVRRRSPAVPHYLVLEDTAGGADRWKFIYDELLGGLSREGVEVERYTFSANLDHCFGPDHRQLALGDLLDHADALIVIGDGDAAINPLSGERARWLMTLHYIPRRLWVNPFPPARWSSGARAIAADTPMEQGAARALAAMRASMDRESRRGVAYPAVIERAPGTASAVEALRAALGDRAFHLVAATSVVGPPAISLARWLAELHALEIDEQDWLCVVTLPWFQTEQWPTGVRSRLSDALGSDVPELSRALVATCDRLLAASEPPRDSGAHLAWQLERAYHAGMRGERRLARRVVNRIARTPLAPQARGVLTALGLRDRARIGLLMAIVIGASLVIGGAGYSMVETDRPQAAPLTLAIERHIGEAAGKDAGVDAPVPLDAGLELELDAAIDPDALAKQVAQCSEFARLRAWEAVTDCAGKLEALGDVDRARELRTRATQELRNRLDGQGVQRALRVGDLKTAQALLQRIDRESVYLPAVRGAFVAAEDQQMERVQGYAQQLAFNLDCNGLERYVAELARSSTKRVVTAARAVPCQSRQAICDTMYVDNLILRSRNQFQEGLAKVALKLMAKALLCKQDPQMYRLAGLYACVAHDATAAAIYYLKLPRQFQSQMIQRCQQEGIMLEP